MSTPDARLSGLPESLAARFAQCDARALGALEVGVACSSFQTEGGLDGPSQPATHWRAWQREGRVERIGPAADLWNRYDELARRAGTLGLDVVRVSLEWARLALSAERIDVRAADAYAHRFTLLRKVGVEPIVTLSHFTHPAWLGDDFWLDERSPELFARYAAAAALSVGRALAHRGERPLARLVTLNEPNMLALATYGAGVFPHRAGASAEGALLGASRVLRCLDHLLAAHVLAVRALRASYALQGWPAPECTTNVNIIDVYTFSGFLLDILRAPSRGVARTALAPWLEGRRARYESAFAAREAGTLEPRGEHLRHSVASQLGTLVARSVPPELFERTVRALYEGSAEPVLDSLAIDVYDPWTAQVVRGADALFAALVGRGAPVSELRAEVAKPWDWTHEPAMLVRSLAAVHDPEAPLPVDVLENGMAQRREVGGAFVERSDGLRRPRYLAEQAVALAWARVGCALPVRTWCYWTLVDNYELGAWAPRFGLYGLPDASADGTVGPWSELDCAGDDAAAVLGSIARSVRRARGGSEEAREAVGELLALLP